MSKNELNTTLFLSAMVLNCCNQEETLGQRHYTWFKVVDYFSYASGMVFLVIHTIKKNRKNAYHGCKHVQVGKNLTKKCYNTCVMAYFSSKGIQNEHKQRTGDARTQSAIY